MVARVIMILIDGVGDVSIPELDNKTPLEHADTPMLDNLAKCGLNGLMDPVEPSLACGSDTAHMSLFGYDPRQYYRGRGAFEAMGTGLLMECGDVAFKCNFATIDANRIVTRRRVDRDFPSWGKPLCDFLNNTPLPSFPNVVVSVKYATEHRCGIVLRGPGLSDGVTGTDPLKDYLLLERSVPLNDSKDAEYTSRVLNELVDVFYTKLSAHPINVERIQKGQPSANMVLLRGPGERINVESFETKHSMKSFMIAPTCIIAGLGLSLQMELLVAPGATGDYHTNLEAKATRAIEAMASDKYDFGFIHIKAVDDAGHDCDLQKKIHFIEKADQMLATLIQGLSKQCSEDKNYSIVVTGDHSTPVAYGDHSFEPVPFTICNVQNFLDNKSSSDNVCTFSEIEAAQGCLGRFPGSQVMPIIQHFKSSTK